MSVITAPETTLCKYIRAVEALKQHPQFDEDDASEVREWMAGEIPAAVVGRRLRATGYHLGIPSMIVGTTTIKQHRLNDCGCRVDI